MDDKPDFLDRDPNAEPDSDTSVELPSALLVEAAATGETSSGPGITFQGNGYDLSAVIGVTIGALVLLSCATCNLGYYCMPFIPIVLGIIGLVAVKNSVNPDRTRLLSWLSVGAGTAILLLTVLFTALYLGLIVFAIVADNGGF